MFFTLFVLLSALLSRFCYTSPVAVDSLFANQPAIPNDDDSGNFGSSDLIADKADLDLNFFYDDSSTLSNLNLPLPALDSAHFDSRSTPNLSDIASKIE